MYSAHNKGKPVVAKIFIRTLMNKIYKYTTAASKDVYIDKLNDIVNKYNNAYHRTIKLKPISLKDNIHILTLIKNLMINPKFKIGDHVRISNIKRNLLTDILQIGMKKFL